MFRSTDFPIVLFLQDLYKLSEAFSVPLFISTSTVHIHKSEKSNFSSLSKKERKLLLTSLTSYYFVHVNIQPIFAKINSLSISIDARCAL